MTQPIPQDEMRGIYEMVHGPVGPTGPVALGGAYDGAARFDKQIAGWNPPIQSADLDMLPNKETLDARSRDLNRNDAYVQAGTNLHKDFIVGSFYILNCKPDWKMLGKTEEWAEEFQQEVEAKFTLWAESPMKWVDAAGQNDLTSLIRLAVGVATMGGEVLATVEYLRDSGRDFHTAIQMIDSDRLATPHTRQHERNVRGGIRHDRFGRQVSAFIRVEHPMDYMMQMPSYAGGEDWFKEVPFRKPWGRQQVIYLREQNRVDQTRAVAGITAGLREIAITRKFRDVTLQNAVVNATYAATIESELPSSVVYEQLGAGQGGTSGGVVDYAEAYLNAINEYVGSSKNMLLDGARIPHLFPGTKMNMQPAGNSRRRGPGLREVAAALHRGHPRRVLRGTVAGLLGHELLLGSGRDGADPPLHAVAEKDHRRRLRQHRLPPVAGRGGQQRQADHVPQVRGWPALHGRSPEPHVRRPVAMRLDRRGARPD